MTIDVVCVFWGTKFSDEYVYKLKAMIERNTTVPFRFVCLSDRPLKGIETRILKPGMEGWWNKLQLFDPHHELNNRIVYLDLDTIITGNIDWLMNYRGEFMGIEDLGCINPWQPHLKNKMQTGIIAFDRSKNFMIWTEFVMGLSSVVKTFRGDGEYLEYLLKGRDLVQRLYGNVIKSYKYQVYPDRPDKETSIICFHGRPSIIEATNTEVQTARATYKPVNWIEDYWKV